MRREPTPMQLLQAWHALARPDWLPVDQLMNAHCRYLVVRALALDIANGRTNYTTPPTPAPSFMGSLRVPHQPPQLDRKRAAAGEREDD
jgi:hypothetical protein